MFLVNEETDAQGRFVGFSGYKPGHKLRVAYIGTLLPDDLDSVSACDELFRIFNADRPADYRGRSMSVGDVVVLRFEEAPRTMAYACSSDGFELVDPPIHAEVR